MVDLNTQAPDVQLVDTDMKPVKISDFRGKVTVLAFYPGAFTSVCTKEMCTFRDNMSKFNSLNAAVVGISVDPPFSNSAFKKSNNLNFPILSDYNREAVKLYGVAAENFAGLKGYTAAKRSVFILDKQGIIRYKWVSDDPRVEPNYEEIANQVAKLQ
ncbi:peroxiredoxin [Candidatus Marsarchaeota G2 archaeon OSP_D]|jgi:Peroxiredoxin|uniref:Peroxiredoxin n=5 Tax=Candidatus Marsarchaeota group 2 TaxID=2203771 RepID=A0A2R6BC99_9ARCH|nr:MAG: peroxiredoxin [Candidatus Marsarchaeota G2 archaeon ECH_B_SAG-M15]PSN91600.1 MAG: peroxiredoxin [Candidatus Marsarchaeota G2 archaeon OSP_D]PSN96262.1 MAG: peroxiredoxin [Candidatus Marsarchaeota G2 archaeon ECH_B_2]PSO00921.1 MAG: peroxiredoxin [Candidatus Marsarchaeota G2 archaeon ECH_B_3]PSO02839.1 MAG: peroxiredoxin [Candidatus Marsarchaeota G2 archaeon ECH_B_1]